MDFINTVKFDANGLVPAIAQDDTTGEILMVAYMNRESLQRTVKEKRACYWSRSRQEFWIKGATSGHTQEVKEILLDCDGDALVLKIVQKGGACHEGYRSCFFRNLNDRTEWSVFQDRMFDEKKVYGT